MFPGEKDKPQPHPQTKTQIRPPDQKPEIKNYSDAKPLNHDSFKNQDARTATFRHLDEIELTCKVMRSYIDTPKDRQEQFQRMQLTVEALGKVLSTSVPAPVKK